MIKTMPIKSIRIRIKIKLNLTISLLPTLISLKLRSSKNVIKTVKEAIQSLGSMPLRLSKRAKIRPKTSTMSNTTPINKKVTMPTSALKSQTISGNFDNLHIND